MVVASWLAARGTDDSVGFSPEDSEGVPGWVCSLLIINCSKFAYRRNSVRLIAFLLLANNATSARLAAQSLLGNASDSPQIVQVTSRDGTHLHGARSIDLHQSAGGGF
jgi:hypothetical protein